MNFFFTGDKNLLQSLVFDALVTDSLEKLSSQISKADKQWVNKKIDRTT